MTAAPRLSTIERQPRRRRGKASPFKPNLSRHDIAAAVVRETGIRLPSEVSRAVHAWALHGGMDATTIIGRIYFPTIGGIGPGVSRAQLAEYVEALHRRMAENRAGDDPRAAAVGAFLSVLAARLLNHPVPTRAHAAGIVLKVLSWWPNSPVPELPRAAQPSKSETKAGCFAALPASVQAVVRAASRCDVSSLAIWGALDLHALGVSDRTLRNWMRADRRGVGSRWFRRLDSEDPSEIAGLLSRYLHAAGDELSRRVRLALAAEHGIAVDREGVVCP